ncbi:MAG: hypothetical protein Kow0092_24080 [Deferrisomatales bacterium]
MSVYPYRCAQCGKEFDVTMRPSEVGRKAVTCPACNAKSVQRVYGAFFAKTSRKS